jgi:hypothetical protein
VFLLLLPHAAILLPPPSSPILTLFNVYFIIRLKQDSWKQKPNCTTAAMGYKNLETRCIPPTHLLFISYYLYLNFFSKDQIPLQRFYLNQLLTSENLNGLRNSNPISGWHGTNSKHLDSVCWYFAHPLLPKTQSKLKTKN